MFWGSSAQIKPVFFQLPEQQRIIDGGSHKVLLPPAGSWCAWCFTLSFGQSIRSQVTNGVYVCDWFIRTTVVDWPEERVPAGPKASQQKGSWHWKTRGCPSPGGWERYTGSSGSLLLAARHSAAAPNPTFPPSSGRLALIPSACTTDDLQVKKNTSLTGFLWAFANLVIIIAKFKSEVYKTPWMSW